MKIGYIINKNSNSAVIRRRLLCFIEIWQIKGCIIEEWQQDKNYDLIYIVDLPSVLNKVILKLFKYNRKYAIVVGLIEDLFTSKWAAINDENIDSLEHLIISQRRRDNSFIGKIRIARDYFANMGLINSNFENIRFCIKNADGVIATSELQAASLRSLNPNIVGIADCIPDDDYIKLDHHINLENQKFNNDSSVTLVWEGTSYGLQLLELIREPLNYLVKKSTKEIRLRLVMPKKRFTPLFNETDNDLLASQRFIAKTELFDWSIYSAGSLISSSDIGLAPMPVVNPFYLAKAYSKPLVYMNLGLPVVASDIPSYRELIPTNDFGFIAKTKDEWLEYLLFLVENPKERGKIGMNAKRRVSEFHSIDIVANKFYNFFVLSCSIQKLNILNK